eukprot:TRINITY_DN4874_c0_g1_i6.p2 TRINITY_DN4874_c0_g1~~TRINITY_DN4874_c0_g1_i6.p2  ORF type:complete len:128 (-),score=17.80 TRINITY_DN4874_c0_g1_i6:1029-1412(-)
MEVRDLLTSYDFPGDSVPVIIGSALKALEGDNGELGSGAIDKLVAALDSYIPIPVRQVDKPFLLPIEDVFSISGRGTVVTGRIERGIVKVGEEIGSSGINAEYGERGERKWVKKNLSAINYTLMWVL